MRRLFAFLFLLAGFTLACCCCESAAQEKAPSYPEHQDLSYFLDDTGTKQPIRRVGDWEKRKGHVLANMQVVMGSLDRKSTRLNSSHT